jgi:Matrixin
VGPHSGLTFTKVGKDNNCDISVGWGKLGRTANGALIGGNTGFPQANLVTITFNDGVSWTAYVDDKNYADFFTVAMHEIGLAIGMEHSSDPDAIMAPRRRPYSKDSATTMLLGHVICTYSPLGILTQLLWLIR